MDRKGVLNGFALLFMDEGCRAATTNHRSHHMFSLLLSCVVFSSQKPSKV